LSERFALSRVDKLESIVLRLAELEKRFDPLIVVFRNDEHERRTRDERGDQSEAESHI